MVDLMSPSCADVHRLLSSGNPGTKLLPSKRDVVLTTLRDFVTANEDPRASPNYRDQRPDEVGAVQVESSGPIA
jgi:hypothetical protein